MTRSLARPTLALALLAGTAAGCACGPPEGVPERDGGPRPDAPLADSPGSDAGGSDDAAGGDDAGPTCGALGGGTHSDLGCARSSGGFATQVAILEGGATPRVRISGFGLGSAGACAAVDHVEVTAPSGVLASFDLSGSPLGDLGQSGWLEGPATALATAFCAGDVDRFDAVQLVLTGRGVGSTFTTTCGGSAGGGWPPSLVVTCHRGIEPPSPRGLVSYDGARTFVQAWSYIDTATTVTAIDADADVIEATFGGGSTTVPTTGWRLVFWAGDIAPPGLVPAFAYSLQAETRAEVLGAACVAPMTGPPPPSPPPALIVRLTGASAAGAFSTELYSEGCYRTMP